MPLKDLLDGIHRADAAEALRTLEDDCIDLVLTSPPYDALRNYKRDAFPFEAIAAELHRVLRPGGVMVWVVGDATVGGSETGTSFRQALHFRALGLNLHDTMIFRKRNPVPQIYRKRYTSEFDYMFVFSKGPVATHHPIMVDCLHAGRDLGSTTYKNYSRNAQLRGKRANPVKATKLRGNVWEYVVGKLREDQEAKAHPAPFPCALARDHILSWSSPGDVVLDPMCGSGTTCKVARELGRRWIGIEVAQEYVDLARARLASTPDTAADTRVDTDADAPA